jgi:hypothetical protein
MNARKPEKGLCQHKVEIVLEIHCLVYLKPGKKNMHFSVSFEKNISLLNRCFFKNSLFEVKSQGKKNTSFTVMLQ